MLAIHIIVFAHLVWLGLYLRNRAGDSRAGSYSSAALLFLAYVTAHHVFSNADESNSGFALVLVFPAAGFLVGALYELLRPSEQSERARAWPVMVGFLFGAVAFALVALMDLSADSDIVDLAVPFAGAAFIICGLFVGRRLAGERGEAFLPDVFRSYDYSFLIASLFGGQVVLAMWTGPGATGPMVFLLIGTITAAIAIQVYLDRVQSLLDRIAFANVPWLRQERAELRQVENLLPRVNMTDPLTIEKNEFSRLTRRALSNYGDLTKLATSPLTNLPEVHRRLAARQVEPSTLERARELKVLLAEAIEQLKPRTSEDHGTTDEWRFYNALYYPYIVGMRPYSTTAVHSFDAPGDWEALEWFRTYVPERTLYNWQNSAAALIASHLREQEELATSPAGISSAGLTAVS